MTNTQDENKGCRRAARMDFQIEIVHTDEETRTVLFQAIPDPRRYTKIEKDEESFFLDKFLRHLIPCDEIMGEGAKLLKGLPVYALSPSIESISDYVEARKTALEIELDGGSYIPPEETALSHKELNSDPRDLVFLSVDICSGSALRHSAPDAFEQSYKIFLRELGTVVGQFNGAILKLTGDGFISYIDHPSFTRQCDNAIDMGLSFIKVLHSSINPALKNAGLPTLQIRVGADYGSAQIRNIEIPLTGYLSTEIASDALNRAVKIEKSAQENEFLIGRNLYELVHVAWLERAEEIPFNGDSVGISNYKIYRMK